MFGNSSNKPAFSFGDQPQSGFGSPKSEPQFSSPFGQVQTKPQQSSIFGQQQNSQQGGLFGQVQSKPQQGSLFGQQQNFQQGGLFGQQQSKPQQGGLFGQQQPKPQQGGLFGQQQNTQQGGLFGQQQPKPQQGSIFGKPPSTPQQTSQQSGVFGQRQSPFTSGSLFGSKESPKDKTPFSGFGKPKESPNNTSVFSGFGKPKEPFSFGRSASNESSKDDVKSTPIFGSVATTSIDYDMSSESEKKLLNTLTLQKNVKSAVVLIYKSEKRSIYALASTVNDEAFTDSLEKVTNLKINEVTSYDLQNLKPLTVNNISPIMERLELFKWGDNLKINMKKGMDYLPAGEYLFFSYRITLFSLTKWEVTKQFAPEIFMSVEEYKDTVAKGVVSRLLFTNELQKSRIFLKGMFEKQGLTFPNGPEPYFVLTEANKPIYERLLLDSPELIAKVCVEGYEIKGTEDVDFREYCEDVLKFSYQKTLYTIQSVHFKSVSLTLLGHPVNSNTIPFGSEHLALLAKYSPKFTLVAIEDKKKDEVEKEEKASDETEEKEEKEDSVSDDLKAAQKELKEQKEMYEKLSKSFSDYKNTTEAEFVKIQELLKKIDLEKDDDKKVDEEVKYEKPVVEKVNDENAEEEV